MNPSSNFLITIIAITLGIITAVIYILLNIEPNVFWVYGIILLGGVIMTFIASIIFYAFAKLRSFETPKEMYRRQLKKGVVFGMVAIVALLIQKFFDLI